MGKEGKLTWYGDFVGYVRLKAGLESKWQSVQYAVIYLVLVVYTCIFTVMYIKRTLYMAFFTMIAPLIAVTYPLDKIKDGQAQAFSLWFKEFTFNALIQPVHLIIYTITISTVMDMLVTKYPVYALVALGFIMPAEKILRKMFGFEKADYRQRVVRLRKQPKTRLTPITKNCSKNCHFSTFSASSTLKFILNKNYNTQ